jgi:hypothetical protein
LLGKMFFSLGQDCQWQRAWTGELVRTAIADTPTLRSAFDASVRRWLGPAHAALAALEAHWAPEAGEWSALLEGLRSDCVLLWESAGLAAGDTP